MVINLTKITIKSTVRPLGGNLFEGKIKKYFYKEIIKGKFWSLRTDGRVEKMLEKRPSFGGVYCTKKLLKISLGARKSRFSATRFVEIENPFLS
eukprot:UN23899